MIRQLTDVDIRKIYNHLADSDTKNIFANRLLFSLTGDIEYIKRVFCTTAEGKRIL